MLDTIEELLRPEELESYADILLQKIEDDRFPSTPMIARLQELTAP